MANLIVFGDSITQGYWDPEGGWVQRLRRFLDKKVLTKKNKIRSGDYVPVFNLGVDGDTSTGLLKRFESELKVRLSSTETIIIFAIGCNDCLWMNKEKKTWVSEEEFGSNIRSIIRLARKYSSKIIFTGITRPDEKIMSPVPWSEKYSAKNELAERFNAIVKDVCSKNKIHFIDVIDKISEKDLEDGDHPNAEGHEKIFQAVKAYLVGKKII